MAVVVEIRPAAGSNYLVIYCTNKTIFLESETGKVRESIPLHGPQEPDNVQIVFSVEPEDKSPYFNHRA